VGAAKIDPITLEIAMHRLWQITEEMGITLCRTSGSVVTIDSRDYMTAIYDAKGDCIMSGCGVLYHTLAFADAVKYLIREKGQDPGIFDGDVFILNDPYVAALHQADMAFFTPIFYEKRLVGWAATMTHLIDIGGIDPGGISLRATDAYQEGIRFRGFKLAEKGKLRTEIFEFILNSVRDPGMVGLELKAQMAAGETARRRVTEFIDEYGLRAYRAIGKQVIKYAEDKLRSRLRELPDGSWSSTIYQEGDFVSDRIYQVSVTVTKKGDDLNFDFTGSSGQTPACINCTIYGAKGAVFGAVAPLLAYDVPWNQGVFSPLSFVVPEGTLVNAKFPAPVSMATIGAAFLAFDVSLIAISNMLTCSVKYKEEATAQWSASSPNPILSGQNKDGRSFISIIMEGLCGGGGAKTYEDGVDIAGKPWTPEATHPNVESIELQLPILYLNRRMVPDSAGAGMFRGGMAGELCIKPYDSTGDRLSVSLVGMGSETLLGYGISGGYPSHNVKLLVLKNSNYAQRLEQGLVSRGMEDLQGELLVMPSLSQTELGSDDILSIEYNGGGGYGDPLDRAHWRVQADVIDGLISHQYAEEIYGVVFDPVSNQLMEAETNKKRQEIRHQRLADANQVTAVQSVQPSGQSEEAGYPLGEYLLVNSNQDGQVILCRNCGHVFCPPDRNFKEFASRAEFPLTKASPRNSRTNRFVLREFYCPDCATMLEVEVAAPGAPLVQSFSLFARSDI